MKKFVPVCFASIFLIGALTGCTGAGTISPSDGGTMEWKQSFSAALAKLPPELFVRIHRSFCVNLMYVNSITRKNCFLEGGTELPLSRGAYQEANEAFLRYYRDQGF